MGEVPSNLLNRSIRDVVADSAPEAFGVTRTGPKIESSRPRVLVAIASYGEKNLGYLKRTIQQYREMPFPVDVAVITEATKPLPDDVRTVIGLPSRNPWSLPFAHKQLFADEINAYDLFIYSEDDIGVTEANVRAFLRATAFLNENEIAGFLRYERTPSGDVWMPDAHSRFHWDAGSAVNRAGQIFAHYTNEHAAFYILTRAQLRRAIASGGFLREPYAAKYDMLCAAATDPYTSCGFRKMINVSNLDDFLVHHMSDRYAGEMGMPRASFVEHFEALGRVAEGVHPATSLCNVESKVTGAEWSKSYFERPHDVLLSMIPGGAHDVLSIGYGSGSLEAALRARRARVTVLPLDSIVGATAARAGFEVVYGQLHECLSSVQGRTYDCVLVTNLLHLQPDPKHVIARAAGLVRPGGALVIESPNFWRLPILIERLAGRGRGGELRSFAESGVHPLTPRDLVSAMKAADLRNAHVQWYDHALPKRFGLRKLPLRLGSLTAKGFVAQAGR